MFGVARDGVGVGLSEPPIALGTGATVLVVGRLSHYG